MESGDSLVIKIGDYVRFDSIKFKSFLIAEGILNTSINLSEDLSLVENSLFSIHLQRQYSAARECDEFIEANDIDENDVDKSQARYVNSLKKGRDNEVRLNRTYMEKRAGQVVLFGDVIQLYHVKSKKYLKLIPDEVAKVERENLHLTLDEHGDIYSWIQVLPRFKIDREGDPIKSGNEVLLKFSERGNEYMHAADRLSRNSRFREVNSSLEVSSWRASVFQSILEAANRDYLVAYEVIYIHDPETRSNLMIASEDRETENKEHEDSINPLDIEVSMEEEPEVEFYHENGDIILAPMGPTNYIDSNAFWMMESKSIVIGGAIAWKSEKYRFKHLNTGKYLVLKALDEENYILTVTEDNSDEGTLFSVNEMYNAVNKLSNAKAMQISSNNIYLSRGEALAKFQMAITTSNDKTEAINLLARRFESDLPKDANLLEDEPFDAYIPLLAREYLRKYVDMVVIPKSDMVSTIWPAAERSEVEFFFFLLEKMNNFLAGFPIARENVDLNLEKGDAVLRVIRQDIVREQGFLLTMLDLIRNLVFISERPESSGGKSATKLSSETEIMYRMANTVLNQSFITLYSMIENHHENQMFVADDLQVLLRHISGQPVACKCVAEMLGNNVELQETKVGDAEMDIFIEKLKGSKMNAMYLNLLQSCCSCMGDGVDGNQCKVAEKLFQEASDIIIQLHIDTSRFTRVSWGKSTLYIPEEPVPGCLIRGDQLLVKGLPQLALAWTTNSIDFSPLGLFGKLSVNIEDLYALQQDSQFGQLGKTAQSRNNASQQQKLAVASYYIAQMYLGAEMCMDRNYVGMEEMDKLLPYEALISMLKLPVTEELQAAACRVLYCLYVDRDPQAETKIPCLTRTWSDIVKFEVPQLPYCQFSSRNSFALLQQIISDHVQSMIGQPWSTLSIQMLRLLHKLAKFNFYGTNEKLNDIIKPIVAVLDRRQIIIKEDNFVDTKSAKKKKKKKIDDQNPDDALFSDFGGEEEKMDESFYLPEEDKEKEVKVVVPWQKTVLTIMEDIRALLFVLSVVVVAVATTIYEVTVTVSADEELQLYYWSVIACAFFTAEIILRGYCAVYVRKSFFKFFCDIFNQVDVFVISIDIIFLALFSSNSSNGRFVKIARLIRLARLLRLVRAANVIVVVAKTFTRKTLKEYNKPQRYTKTMNHELDTMVEAIEILRHTQNVIEDRNLSIFLRYFYQWNKGDDTRSIGEIFRSMEQEAAALRVGNEELDLILSDLIMFSHTALVDGTLNLIMNHHCMRQQMILNAESVQLLVAPRRERQFRQIDQMLQQLEGNAETHELWGMLRYDSDYATNKQTKDIMKELIEIVSVQLSTVEFEKINKPDLEIQNLLRNLNCFSICFKVLGLLESVEEEDENGELDKVSANTKDLCIMCNELLYWFFLDNPQNQEMGYSELEFFLESVDSDIGSHKSIEAIFSMNEILMRRLPHELLQGMVENIISKGKSHKYLSLFRCIASVGDKNILENQTEIIKCLSTTGRLQKVGCFLVPVKHPDYKEKRELMAPYLNSKEYLTFDDLPPLLGYHCLLIDIFSNCTIGRLNITSIEAKVQSIWNFQDVLDSLLDPGTMLFVKIMMARFLFNAVVEVEMMISGFQNNSSMWKLLKSFVPVLKAMKEQLEILKTHGWKAADLNRHEIEYGIITSMIISSFFNRYYDITTFHVDERNEMTGETFTMTTDDVNALAEKLFQSLHDICEMNSAFLSIENKVIIFDALESLFKLEAKFGLNDLSKLSSSLETKKLEVEVESNETIVIKKLKQFITDLKNDEVVINSIKDENGEFVKVLEALPYVEDDGAGDVRYEHIISKLVNHVRENISFRNGEKRLNPDSVSTIAWVIRMFRTMIENKMGMTIYERDEDGGEEEDKAAAPVVLAFIQTGAITLAVDLIAVGINDEVQTESIKLLVSCLFKEGGARDVQELIYDHVSQGNSDLFFKQLRSTIQTLIGWHKWNDVIVLKEGMDPDLPENFIVIRMLQLMSEGHYHNNQEIMREQSFNAISFNLLDPMVVYLNSLTRIPCRTSTVAGIGVANLALEILQGPCEGNQTYFTLNTELLETMNRMLRSPLVHDCVREEETDLKMTTIDIFCGLLEGQNMKSVVYERIVSVIHLDVIQALSGQESGESESKVTDALAQKISDSDTDLDLKLQCNILIQMLCDYKPALRTELGLSSEITLDEGTASIEVMWKGSLNRRFFTIPDICSDLAKSSKDNLVATIDRKNIEVKLIDFIARAHDLYLEVKHQERLNALNLNLLFSRQNLDYASWGTFFLAAVINALLIAFYQNYANRGMIGPTIVNPNIAFTINILNYVQIAASFYCLVACIVVRSYVTYESFQAKKVPQFWSIVYTSIEPKTIYYAWYLSFAILGIVSADYFTPFLLLDVIVKNATTRDVLMSVIVPRNFLMWSMLFMIFIIYIFSFFQFLYFAADGQGFNQVDPFDDHANETYCNTLWHCFLSCFQDIRSGGGITDFITWNSQSNRLFLQLLFQLIIMIILFNVFFGIMIDTFSSLRADKLAKYSDTVNTCFICGIDKKVFDRLSDVPDGFGRHIRDDHKMWNYLYFIFFLWEQDKDDDDGMEYYVRHCVDDGDITWFPMNHAMCLDLAKSDEEQSNLVMENSLVNFRGNLSNKIENFQLDVAISLDKLTTLLMSGEDTNDNIPIGLGSSILTDFHETVSEEEHEEMIHLNIFLLLQNIIVPDSSEIDGNESTLSVRLKYDYGFEKLQPVSFDKVTGKAIFEGEDEGIMMCDCTEHDDVKVCEVSVYKVKQGTQKLLSSVVLNSQELMEAEDGVITKVFGKKDDYSITATASFVEAEV